MTDHEAEYSREEYEAREDSEHTRRAAVARPLYKCCCPRCPGYPYRASTFAHPIETCAERAGDFK